MYGSTATMKSSVPNASSSLRPFGVDSTGLPATVTIARIWPSPGVTISSAIVDDRQLAAELGQPADPALPHAEVATAEHRSGAFDRRRGNIVPPGRSRLPVMMLSTWIAHWQIAPNCCVDTPTRP